jgi:hypothetical protein
MSRGVNSGADVSKWLVHLEESKPRITCITQMYPRNGHIWKPTTLLWHCSVAVPEVRVAQRAFSCRVRILKQTNLMEDSTPSLVKAHKNSYSSSAVEKIFISICPSIYIIHMFYFMYFMSKYDDIWHVWPTTPCNHPKDHRLHQHRGGSLKSRKENLCCEERSVV